MPRLCESPMKRRSRQGMEEDKVYQRLPMVWPRPSSLPDDAETRHHCSVSSAIHIMSFLSMSSEPIPPPHELHTPDSTLSLYYWRGAQRCDRTHAISEETEERKSVIKTSANISRLRYQVLSLEEEYQVCYQLMPNTWRFSTKIESGGQSCQS